ncbi:SET domain-containing protein [Ditylenchus destructor]|uniref:SET domain-containing protein n=1 Tax=Ditylenchus destructor TaxID=166010 RepID=A0AAD4N3L8_9BILA|nr:SET domain-containing protein [Ditylenchus destructor]
MNSPSCDSNCTPSTSSSCSRISPASDGESSAIRFQEWFATQSASSNIALKIDCDLVELRYCGPGQGFGLFAKENIRRDQTIIRIPKDLLITASMVADLPEYAAILNRVRFEPFEVMAIFFSLEKLYACNSYCPHPSLNNFFEQRSKRNNNMDWLLIYQDVLPKNFSTALALVTQINSTDELIKQEKRKSAIIKQILQDLPSTGRQLFHNQLDEFKRLCNKISSVLDGWKDVQLFSWGWHVVNTRCIFVDSPSVTRWHALVDSSKTGDTIAVIPIVDMLNHDIGAQCVGMFENISQCYCVISQNKSIAEGDQIFVCYGPHDNVKLWLEYGFDLGSDNIYNKVNLPLELFIVLAKETGLVTVNPEHEKVLLEAALPCTIYASDDDPNYGLRKNCSILCMNSNQLCEWRRIVFEDDLNLGDNTQVEELVYAIIRQLHTGLRIRMSRVKDKRIRSFWMDQIVILQNLLTSRIR